MSFKYTTVTAKAEVKKHSRKIIANDISTLSNNLNIVIHYLGGRAQSTPFENLLRSRNGETTFIRYERHQAETPKRYQLTTNKDLDLSTKIKKSHGFFLNGDFFKNYASIINKIKDVEYYWLDFCGPPTTNIVNQIYKHVMSRIELDTDSVCYATFLLNPRGLQKTDIENVFGGYGGTKERRAENIKNYFNKKNSVIVCEVFEVYQNGKSPMGVFKFTNKYMQNISRTIEDLVFFRNAGFNNKEIARYWRVNVMKVAGMAAYAKMKNLFDINPLNDTEYKTTTEETNKEVEDRAA